MDPETLKLIVFAESMAALAAKTFADVRAVLTGSDARTSESILTDADATYQQIIANAKS